MSRRPNGRIMCQFTVDGKRYTVYGATKEECREKELQKREEIKAGTFTRGRDLTVSKYMDQWLEQKESNTTPSTVRTRRKLVNRMIRQPIDKAGHTFGKLKLSELEALQNLPERLF